MFDISKHLVICLNCISVHVDGMIMFPSNDVFQNFGGIGVSMFFVTYVFSCPVMHLIILHSYLQLAFHHRTIISQLVYSFGGSGFAGANGSMMIEVVVRLILPLLLYFCG